MRDTDEAIETSDEAIDRVLAGLRSVEPPIGMERRLMLTLEQRTGESVRGSRLDWRRLRLRLGWRTGGWMLAGALMLTIGLAVARPHRHFQTVRQALVEVPAPMEISAPLEVHILGHQQSSQPKTIKRVRTQASAGKPRMRELAGISFPAPPMPLTEQERLLLRIVHTGDPVELAMLDPKMRALGEEQSKREFLAFFPPPPVPTKLALGDNQ